MRRYAILILMLFLLAGCVSTPAGTSVPTVPATAPTEPVTEAPTAPTEDPSDGIRTGYYVLTAIDDGETVRDGLEMVTTFGYLQILPDRTGLLSINGVVEHVDWTGRYLTIGGTTCKFTIEDDVMTLNYKYEFEATFTYFGENFPDFLRSSAPEPGMYYLTHYIENDEMWYFETPGLSLGYFHLREDGSGIFFNGEKELDVFWKNDTLILSSSPLTYRFFPASETEDGIATLVLYNFGWDMVIYRAIDPDVPDDF